MDLKDLEVTQDELIDVVLLLDNEGAPEAGVKCVGANSDEYQEVDRTMKVKNVQKSARRGRSIEASTENGAKELVDLVAKREFAICVACTKEIYGFVEDGASAELSEALLKRLFAKRPTWRSKIVLAIEAEQLFTKASSAPGAP